MINRSKLKSYFVFPLADLLDPIDESEIADADVGILFFFFTFLFDPSLLSDPDAVAVFFSLGGVSQPEKFIDKNFRKRPVVVVKWSVCICLIPQRCEFEFRSSLKCYCKNCVIKLKYK